MQIPATLFACIACCAAPAVTGPAPEFELAFDFLHNQVVLHGTIDGAGPFDFVLDTGTHATTIDIHVAKRLHLRLGRPTNEAHGVGTKRVLGRRTECKNLRIGALAVDRIAVTAMDLSGVSRLLGRPLHGVLGYGFLGSRIVQIDYFRRRVRVYSESPFLPQVRPVSTPRRAAFRMHFRAGSVLPMLENCLVNGVTIPVTIDTGSSLGLVLFPRAIERLGLGPHAREGTPLDAAGYRGTARLAKGWVKSLVLDTVDLGAVEVAYVIAGYGNTEALEDRGGNVGNALLQDFVVTLDYRNGVVVLEAVEEN